MKPRVRPRPTVDLWFDPICPWSHLGQHRLRDELDRLPPGAERPHVVWRSFQLDPGAPSEPGPTATEVMLAAGADPVELRRRWGRIAQLAEQAGLVIDLDRSRPTSTFDAHRVVRAVQLEGVSAGATVGVLHEAHHGHQLSLTDPDVLVDAGTAGGLDARRVRDLLDGDAYAPEVRADRRRARDAGVTGVPTLQLDDGTGVPLFGDEPVLAVLQRSAGRR